MPHTYDVHTHIGIDMGFYLRRWWPYCASVQDLLLHMDTHGIDRAVSFPFCVGNAYDPQAFAQRGEIALLPGRVPYDRENALLLDEIRRLDKDRRLRPFAMFDPSRMVDEQIKALDVIKGDIAGLKLQATIIKSFVPDLLDKASAFMAFAAEHDLPVLFHTSISPNDPWSRVADCLAVAAANPKVRFNLAHSLRFHAGHLREAAAMANVWIDCSAHLAHCGGAVNEMAYVATKADRVKADYTRPSDVLAAVADIVGGKYMWGSDNPFQSWCDDSIREIHTYQEETDVVHALPPALRQSMLTAAPAAWLGRSA